MIDCHHIDHLQIIKKYNNITPQCFLFGQAPYRWRHAHLSSMKEYLKQQVDDGEYEPIMRSGLYDDM